MPARRELTEQAHLIGFPGHPVEGAGSHCLKADWSCREPIGSCVAVSAALLPEHSQNILKAGKTPVLITHGEKDREVPRAAVNSSVELLNRAGRQARPSVMSILEKKAFSLLSANMAIS